MTFRKEVPMPRNDALRDRFRSGPFGRRQLVGGAAGIATATTAAVVLGPFVSAQVSPGTVSFTPEHGLDERGSELAAQRAAVFTDRSAAVIASVKADRNALASSLDTADIDEMLSLAGDFQQKAEAAPVATDRGHRSSQDASPVQGSEAPSTASTLSKQALAFAATRSAQAAREMIVAQMVNFGLPSDQAAVSRTLAATHQDVSARATTVGPAGVEEASTLMGHAEAAYTRAYAAYNAGTYARAAAYGGVAAHLAEAAAMLVGGSQDDARETATGQSRSTRGLESGSTNETLGATSGSDGDLDTPVTVPEPTF